VFFWGLNIGRFLTEEKLEKQRETPPAYKHFIVDLFVVILAGTCVVFGLFAA